MGDVWRDGVGRTVCTVESCARLFYSPSSSSNTLASWRLAVSNPSVNQRSTIRQPPPGFGMVLPLLLRVPQPVFPRVTI